MKQVVPIAALLAVILTGCGHSSPASVANLPTNAQDAGSGSGNQAANTVPDGASNVVANNATAASGSTVSTNPWDRVYMEQVTLKSKQNTYVYPQIHGLDNVETEAKLNQLLKQAGTPAGMNTDTPHTVQSSYSLLMKRGAFLELMFYAYDYPEGAAHGMPSQTPVLINLKDGTEYHIGDLFHKGSNYLQLLSNGVRAADAAHVLGKDFTGVTNKDGFYLSDAGVTVFFSPYEWTPFAMGFPQFAVPYTALSDSLNTSGVLWQVLHEASAQADANVQAQDVAKIRGMGYAPLTDAMSSFAAAATVAGDILYVWDAEPKGVMDGTAQKLFFFLGNKYLGTDTVKDHGPIYRLTPSHQGSIDAAYTSGTGDFTITYHWDGSKLRLSPDFPASYKDWSKR